MAVSTCTIALTHEDEKRKMLTLLKEESAKCESWKRKYIPDSMFVLGSGAYGSVFQVTTRLYYSKQKLARNRMMYHPNFVGNMASQRKLRPEMQEKLRDKTRDTDLLDIIAIKYEILEQAHLEDGATRFSLFLRREFLVLDTIWRKNYRILHGFPVVFEFDFLGDKSQFGVHSKYRNIFTYLNIEGEEVKFFADGNNRNLENVTKISYMSMELLGPSIDDLRGYFEPWYAAAGLKTFFQVRTVFKLADQVLCRLLVLHKSGFVHHDIKPDNVALGNGRAMNVVYLLDFGFAKQVSNCRPPEWMGSRKFISVDTYAGAKPNYAQDIESWFYLVISLLFDALPWTDEFIIPMLGDNADESARWNLVTQMKKSWWCEISEAASLREIFKSIASVHSAELPDIRCIMEQLHKRTRDLRAAMRAIDDAQTLNFELANNQSALFRGYMSIRKVLLQIFNLPNIGQNTHLGDSEFRSLQQARAEKNLKFFDWDRRDFEWEWDANHRILCSHTKDAREANDQSVPVNRHSAAASFVTDTSEYQQFPASTRASLRSLLVMGRAREQRPDEVSYVFDRRWSMLRPKVRHADAGNRQPPPLAFCADEDGFEDNQQAAERDEASE